MGRNQRLASVDLAACERRGYDLVRRPTGGRSILHTDELTYSIAARPEHPLMAGMVLETYLRLSNGLVTGLHKLGIPAEEAPGTNRAGPDVSAACFEVPSAYEIVAGGRKLMGSAQSRRADFILQHGSLPLAGDLTRVVDCLAFASDAEREALRRSLTERAATAEQVLGHPIAFEEAAAALIAGVSETLGVTLAPAELTPLELGLTEQLVRERYAHPSWTEVR
jgi:lipoate-protein ligase A